MKRLTSLILGLSLIIYSCQDPEEELPQPTDVGYLSMSITLTITSEEADGRTEAVNTDDYKVTIFDAGGTEIMVFDPFSSAPPEVALPTGEYYVEANSNDLVEAAFDSPYYFGRSANFTIDKEETASIDITPELANTKVAILYSDNVVNTFSSYTGTVTVISSGTNLFYGQGETREGYFVVEPLSIDVDLSYLKLDGTTIDRTFTTALDNPQPKTLYNINVDAELVDGVIGINITVDETVDTVNIDLGEVSVVGENCLLTQFGLFEDGAVELYDMTYSGSDLDFIDYTDNDSDYTTIFTNDAQGRISQVDYSGDFVGREVYNYNTEGQMVERLRYRDDGSGLEFNAREVYTYNTNGQIEKYEAFREDGSGNPYLDEWSSFEYPNDSTWNPSKQEKYNTAGVNYVDRYYTYDANPNPIRTSGLWICDDCLDFEAIPFTDNNVTYMDGRDGADTVTEEEFWATYEYNVQGFPTRVDYLESSGDGFYQTYQYNCN